MSEVATQSATDSAAAGSDPSSTGDAGATTPEGFVPLAEVEKVREEARRARQAAEDLRQELNRTKAAPKPDAEEAQGFDLDGFRKQMLRDVSGVITISQTAQTARSEFPNADPALFDPERIAQFSSPDSYLLAVEDSHRRVADLLDAGWQEREAKLRDELGTQFGDAGARAGGTGTPVAGGDPTPQQIAAMSFREKEALEAANPGVIQRVAMGAGQ